MDEEYEQEIAGTPRDLHELYLTARAETFVQTTFYHLYFKILFLIDIGKEMLPDTEDCIELRNSAVQLLEDMKTYPSASQMEYTAEGNYRISTSRQDTGLIEVREQDLEQGREESREQKATQLLPRLKRMDSRIFEKLVAYGIIDIKKPSLEELMRQDVMTDMQSGVLAEIEKQEAEKEKESEKEVKESSTKTTETPPKLK